jgi:hypothetical protein
MKPLQNSYSDLNLNPLLISQNLTMYMWLICPTVQIHSSLQDYIFPALQIHDAIVVVTQMFFLSSLSLFTWYATLPPISSTAR